MLSKVAETTVLAALTLLTGVLSTALAYAANVPGVVLANNPVIANVHPVYALPAFWAFTPMWIIIFTFNAFYAIYQALPATWYGGLEDEAVAGVRIPTAIMFACLVMWTFTWGNELYWAALLALVTYAGCAHAALRSIPKLNYFTSSVSLKTKVLVVVPLSLQAGWGTIASLLNVQVALLEEGWPPSSGFTVGLVIVFLAFVLPGIVTRADVALTFTSAWALGGLFSQQVDEESGFGCASRICERGCHETPELRMCKRANNRPLDDMFSPNGWKDLCSDWEKGQPDKCVVELSSVVAGWAMAGVVIVLVAMVAGILLLLAGADDPKPEKRDIEATEVEITPSSRESLKATLNKPGHDSSLSVA